MRSFLELGYGGVAYGVGKRSDFVRPTHQEAIVTQTKSPQSPRRVLYLGLIGGVALSCSDVRNEGGGAVDTTFGTGGPTSVGTQGGGDTDGGGATAGGASDGGGGGGVRFDVAGPDMPGVDPDAPPRMGCGCDSQSLHNYIWVSNSEASTVSKINTATVQEEGRYATRSDLDGDPSRTSVTISGRAAVVANRRGGVTKFWANREDCIDLNSNGQIETSTGADDVLPWGTDECMAWHTPFDYGANTSNRPVAWTCINDREMLWTAATGGSIFPDAEAHLLDGATGMVVQTTTMPSYGGAMYGPYGGAVDSSGSFWNVPMGLFTDGGPEHQVHRVDATTYEHQSFPLPGIEPYGITVDGEDNVWVTNYGFGYGDVSAARFTPGTETWDLAMGAAGDSGIAAGPDGRLWAGGGSGGVHHIDPVTLVVGQLDAGVSGIKGISLDSGGFLWAIDRDQAYKIDRGTAQIAATYAGLDGPYTYSDMSGFGVQTTVGCVPPPPP